MPRYLVCLVLLFACFNASAGKVQHASVEHVDGQYYLKLGMLLEVQGEPVWDLISDHDQFHRISDEILESEFIGELGRGIKQRRLLTRTCVLVFCFSAKIVEQFREDDYSIRTRFIPGLSDFDSGATTWRVIPLDENNCMVEFESELEPAFWIPPVLGPYIMKKKLLSVAKKSIRRIETLAANG